MENIGNIKTKKKRKAKSKLGIVYFTLLIIIPLKKTY